MATKSMAVSSPSEREIRARLVGAGIALPDSQIGRLGKFLRLLDQWNRVYNLTGIRGAAQILERNLLECLILRRWLRGSRIADVGSGAGLPGVPLAIVEAEREFTLIESRAKRVHFLRHVCGALPLPNVHVAHSRAEDLPSGLAFDTVLARAVAPPSELLDLTMHLTAPGGTLLVLTSAERSAQFAGLTADFKYNNIAPADAPWLRSAIVLMERIDV